MSAPLSFPEDELAHSAIIEWWYLNGNLRSADNREFSFMYCLFKADPAKIKLPFLDKVPVKDFYFSHFLISDIAANQHQSGVHFFYENIDKESFSKPLLFVRQGEDFLFEENPISRYRLRTDSLDLSFQSKKEPLLVGGSGWIDLKTKSTYYYSLTNLETSGIIRFNNEEIRVSGLSWMDHQWANTYFSAEDHWVWFSLQLENGVEVLCFEYGKIKKTLIASRIDAEGNQLTAKLVKLTPLKRIWTSPKTKARYPVEWRIEIPEWGMSVTTKPKAIGPEVIFGSINYWEGGIEVSGILGKEKISGQGFMELVGIPMGKSTSEFYLEEAKKLVSEYLAKYGYRP